MTGRGSRRIQRQAASRQLLVDGLPDGRKGVPFCVAQLHGGAVVAIGARSRDRDEKMVVIPVDAPLRDLA
jgi:hypothetical protein